MLYTGKWLEKQEKSSGFSNWEHLAALASVGGGQRRCWDSKCELFFQEIWQQKRRELEKVGRGTGLLWTRLTTKQHRFNHSLLNPCHAQREKSSPTRLFIGPAQIILQQQQFYNTTFNPSSLQVLILSPPLAYIVTNTLLESWKSSCPALHHAAVGMAQTGKGPYRSKKSMESFELI